MYSLRVLGGFSLESVDGRGEVSVRLRRAEALLALLAVTPAVGCTRDRAIALLWPESDWPHARHNLRDALYLLHSALGTGGIRSDGDTLRLGPDVVSDVEGFRESLAAERWADAVEAYGGPLLDGFHVPHALEFEHWIADHRGQLLRGCIGAIERLAQAAEAEGQWPEASAWWARAIDQDRCNSRLIGHRMVSLARSGDPANAVKEGAAACQMLREEFDLEPDQALLDLLHRVRLGEFADWPHATAAGPHP